MRVLAYQSGWPVADKTAFHRSPVTSIRFFSETTVVIGTWMSCEFHRPISTSVLPAIAACTAYRPIWSLRMQSNALAGTLRMK